ncbi:MAG: glycine oxidase ThiO [Burkholderiales bacterium]|nr:glycine oxidase ThiO [Burkholderiales bacterium]
MYPDFIVVGAGVIGLATAFELARRGASVTLIERGRVGRESSWAGAGILSVLPPWDYDKGVIDLARYSETLYSDWVASLEEASGTDCEYRRSGMLMLGTHDDDRARDWLATFCAGGEKVAARAIAPQLSVEREAWWLPHTAQVRPPRLLKALRGALSRMDVNIIENTEVLGFCQSGSRIVSLRCREGEAGGGQFVVCAGAWSQRLLGEHALALDICPVRGQMLLFNCAPNTFGPMLLEDDFYLVPRADGHILAGSTVENVGFDKSTTAAAREELMAHAHALLPLLNGENLAAQWAGLRPAAPGNIPAIARHPHIDNLYINSGHFRYGVTMAPGSAQLLAAEALGLPAAIDIAPYRWPTEAHASKSS